MRTQGQSEADRLHDELERFARRGALEVRPRRLALLTLPDLADHVIHSLHHRL